MDPARGACQTSRVQGLSPTSYRIYGVFYLLAALPGVIALATGRIHPGPGSNPYVPLSLGGIPLGLLFLAFAADRFPRQYLSDVAVRVGAVGLFQLVCMAGAYGVVQTGREGFLTAYLFFGMATSFLALVAFVLLVTAALRGAPKDTP